MMKKSFLECTRSPIKYIVLILIFAASFIALFFTINYNNYVQKNVSEIDKAFTSIAVPNTQYIYKQLPDPYIEIDGNISINYAHESDLYLSLRDFVNEQNIGKLDNSEILRGVGNNVLPVLSGAFDPLKYHSDKDIPCNSAAFIVSVMEVEYMPKVAHEMGIVYSGIGAEDSACYKVKFHVDETIVLNSSYKVPEYIHITSGAFTQDGQSPFEVGKQYFISGIYYGVSVIQRERDNGTPYSDIYYELDKDSVPNIYLDGSNFSFNFNIYEREPALKKNIIINDETATAYTYSEKELTQMCVAFDGNLDALLLNRPDVVKRLERARANASSIIVRTTDNLNSVLYFNLGKAQIIDGRNFTEKEILSGESVCVISKQMAEFNNLKLGDSFNVDIYNPIMRRITNSGIWGMIPYHDLLNPHLHEKEISRANLDIKVVGIYTTPLEEQSAYSISYNTVFIPSNSINNRNDNVYPSQVDEQEMFESFSLLTTSPHMIPALFSVIIPNNRLDEFKNKADTEGYGEYFIYNDQGYSQIKDTLPFISKSTRVFIITALAGSLSVLILYISLLPRKCQELGILLLIGEKRSKAILSVVFDWILIIIPALIISLIVFVFTSTQLTNVVLSSTLEKLGFNDDFSIGSQLSPINLSEKFSSGMNDYLLILALILGIFSLYSVIAIIFYLLKSRESVIKLLRRRE